MPNGIYIPRTPIGGGGSANSGFKIPKSYPEPKWKTIDTTAQQLGGPEFQPGPKVNFAPNLGAKGVRVSPGEAAAAAAATGLAGAGGGGAGTAGAGIAGGVSGPIGVAAIAAVAIGLAFLGENRRKQEAEEKRAQEEFNDFVSHLVTPPIGNPGTGTLAGVQYKVLWTVNVQYAYPPYDYVTLNKDIDVWGEISDLNPMTAQDYYGPVPSLQILCHGRANQSYQETPAVVSVNGQSGWYYRSGSIAVQTLEGVTVTPPGVTVPGGALIAPVIQTFDVIGADGKPIVTSFPKPNSVPLAIAKPTVTPVQAPIAPPQNNPSPTGTPQGTGKPLSDPTTVKTPQLTTSPLPAQFPLPFLPFMPIETTANKPGTVLKEKPRESAKAPGVPTMSPECEVMQTCAAPMKEGIDDIKRQNEATLQLLAEGGSTASILGAIAAHDTRLSTYVTYAQGRWGWLADKWDWVTEQWQKLWNSRAVDRAMNILILASTLTNTRMLVVNLGQTIEQVVTNILTSWGIKDAEITMQKLNDILGNSIEGAIKAIIGADNYTTLKAEWKYWNTILTAANGILQSIDMMFQQIAQALQSFGEIQSKVGNALKRSGVVLEDSYNWLQEKFYINTSRIGRIANLNNSLNQTLEFAQNFEGATANAAEITQSVQQIQEAQQTFKEAQDTKLSELIQKENQKKTNSGAPELTLLDLVKPYTEPPP